MRINTNVNALLAWRNLNQTNFALSKTIERLSSGYRINKAADDAAGLAIANVMMRQIRGLRVAQRNAQDAISLVQTAEGGITEIENILQRLNELANQAASDSVTDSQRALIQEEVNQLIAEIDRIANNTEFNGRKVIDGSLGATGSLTMTGVTIKDVSSAESGSYTVTVDTTAKTVKIDDGKGRTQTLSYDSTKTSQVLAFDVFGIKLDVNGTTVTAGSATLTVTNNAVKFQVGSESGQYIQVNIGDMDATALGVNALDVTTQTGAQSALSAVKTALDKVSSERAKLGAVQNRLEHTIRNLGVAEQNLSEAHSRIRDADVALEMAEFTRQQILLQAGTAMLAQANVVPQTVLKLLAG